MDRRARHDLRQPIATMSMIATTLAQFGEEVDDETKGAYRAQVEMELGRLDELLEKYGVDMALEGLRRAARSFLEGVDEPARGREMENECSVLLEFLRKRGGAS